MRISAVISPKTSSELLILAVLDEKLHIPDFLKKNDADLVKNIQSFLKKIKFKGENKKSHLLSYEGLSSFSHILILGLGKKTDLDLEKLRQSMGESIKRAKSLEVKKVLSGLGELSLKNANTEEIALALTEGALLADYEFVSYKSKSKDSSIQDLSFSVKDKSSLNAFGHGIEKASVIADAVYLSRNLANTPSADKPPVKLAQVCQKIPGLKTKVFHEAELKRLKMNGILAVGQGSDHPSVLVEMIYKPKKKAKKVIALVGKGITFDSGGLSLKPAKSMEGMKDDMSGAGDVIATMQAISLLKPDVEVRGYIASAENMPGSKAQRPGDVYKAYNGTTVEVLNTDAEGRLVLGDALAYACEKNPDYIIDMATLTGACLVALGDRYAAIMGTDPDLVKKLIDAGNYVNEKLWELPLPEEYEEQLKSPVADIQNIGGPYGGSITAGLFLKHFVGKTKWAHIDIAGPSHSAADLPYIPKGATGFMVRTLCHFLTSF